MYTQEIEADKDELKKLGLDSKMAQFETELQERLSGKTDDEGGDNMLMQNAMDVPESEYKKFM